MLLKLYFNRDLFLNGYLFDIFFRDFDHKISIAEGARKYFQLVDEPETADFIFIPVPLSELVRNIKGRKSIQSHVEIAKVFNKKVFVVSDADLIFDPGFKDIVILTPGVYKSLRNQIAIPALLNKDPYVKWFGENWEPLDNPSCIRVGFCGQATSHKLKYIKDQLQYVQLKLKKIIGDKTYLYIPYFFAANEREKILKTLEKSSLINTEFIKRERYKGGAKSESDLLQLEADFFQNIYGNLFTICIRGFGNYSVRFFQTLAMGRIPVVIESDSALPFESQINYQNICIQVPFRDRFQADQYIRDFLNDKTLSDLVRIQTDCRQTWLKYFTKPAYFKAMNIEIGNYLSI